MPSAQAQRTLVKSPPELWTELSDPVSLARHLGDVGEIRIARVEPETKVEWEAESASGTVELKPSGWGTKVTLTIAREAPEPAIPEPEPDPEPEPQPKPESEAVEPEPDAAAEPQLAMKPEPAMEPKPATAPEPATEPEPEVEAERPRRWWAKLFRRRRPPRATVAPDPESEAVPEPEAAPEPRAEHTPDEEPGATEQEPQTKPSLNLAAELADELVRLEEAMAVQDAELLSNVLDRLGAAHHRPFSRG